MATTRDHYDRHLGPVYSWMTGDFDALCRRSAALFDRLGLEPVEGAAVAVDLGAGHGAQSVPLAKRGFDVVAVDFCGPLLEELRRNAAGLRITAIEGDLLDFKKHVGAPVQAVVCMGDTLPHLASKADVEKLIGDAAGVLAQGGVFVATFRDYVSAEARGEARFIPVRATDDMILTCFLDYVDADTVRVYDLVHRRVGGEWRQAVGSYSKLRLDPAWVEAVCERTGLVPIERSTSNGMVTLAAAKS